MVLGRGSPALWQDRCRSGSVGGGWKGLLPVSTHRGADEPGASAWRGQQPLLPICPAGGVWAVEGVHRLGGHRGLAKPHPPVCRADCPVHGHAEAGLWRECLGSGSCPTPAHWPWGPETTFSPVRRALGRRRTAHRGRIYFPFDFQPFQESAYPPSPSPYSSGNMSFFSFYQRCRCERGRCVSSSADGPEQVLAGRECAGLPAGALGEGGACPRLPGSGGEGASWQAALSLGAHLPPGS